jgi:peptidase E
MTNASDSMETPRQTPQPVYLLAGKHAPNRTGRDPLLQAVFQQAGKRQPAIAYVGAASGDDRNFLRWLTSYFKAAGSGAVRLAPTASSQADPEEARAVLESADLIFISGGDVEEGMRLLNACGASGVLRRLHRRGVPFFGLSAGSIMLARSWVRWTDPDNDATAETLPCLGFAPVLCDVHAEAEDWEELRVLLKLTQHKAVGYGIPSGRALCVQPDGRAAALGGIVQRLLATPKGVRRMPDLMPDPAHAG